MACLTSPAGLSLVALLAAAGCSKPAPESPPQGDTPPAAPAPVTRVVRPPAEAPHWDYEENGPARWGALSPAFASCGEGHSQSPIDIRGGVRATVPEMRADFRPAELRIVHHEHMADVVNTGHSVQVDYPEGDTLAIGADRYALLQFHFHSPSEHHVDGRPYAAEMHLVHKAADGRLAVVGVLIEEGATNTVFEQVRVNLPAKKGEQLHLPHVTVDVDELLPRASGSYRYTGSLTTPPCSEGVTWIVMTTPITASAEQLAKLRAVLVDNNRPVQPLYDRKILVERVGETSAQASR